jgi:hypothetical protein
MALATVSTADPVAPAAAAVDARDPENVSTLYTPSSTSVRPLTFPSSTPVPTLAGKLPAMRSLTVSVTASASRQAQLLNMRSRGSFPKAVAGAVACSRRFLLVAFLMLGRE